MPVDGDVVASNVAIGWVQLMVSVLTLTVGRIVSMTTAAQPDAVQPATVVTVTQ